MSNRLKNILKSLLVFGGSLGFLYFSFGIFVGMTSGESIKKNIEILSKFKLTATFVDAFKKENLRLPTQKEIESHFGDLHPIFIDDFQDSNRPQFVIQKPEDSYVLHFWQGEWADYYAGWNQQTTLTLDKDSYFPFSSPILSVIAVFASFAVVLTGFRLRTS